MEGMDVCLNEWMRTGRKVTRKDRRKKGRNVCIDEWIRIGRKEGRKEERGREKEKEGRRERS